MSAYKRIECHFKDRELLLESLEKLGFHPECYEAPEKLRGYMNDRRNDLAHIVVPKEQIEKLYTGHASNDLGFFNNDGEYVMIVSDYDIAHGVGDKVQQSYAKSAIENALKKNKFNITDVEVSKESPNRQKIKIQANKIV